MKLREKKKIKNPLSLEVKNSNPTLGIELMFIRRAKHGGINPQSAICPESELRQACKSKRTGHNRGATTASGREGIHGRTSKKRAALTPAHTEAGCGVRGEGRSLSLGPELKETAVALGEGQAPRSIWLLYNQERLSGTLRLLCNLRDLSVSVA